ncbi:MAG: hypothetical protein LBS35_00890 [Synergistaceae bacterium]|jgi:hypothetical protein|nr:hypothetical protein [Synergistaceae bacterium]
MTFGIFKVFVIIVTEGYHIGGFACVLLDRFENDWQERLMADAETTPIEMLSRRFAGANLPAPRQPADEEIKESGASGLFKMLYNLLF